MRSSWLRTLRVLQSDDVELLIGDDRLQLAVLMLELHEALGLAHVEPAVLLAPVVEGVRADAVPTAQLLGRGSGLGLLQDE